MWPQGGAKPLTELPQMGFGNQLEAPPGLPHSAGRWLLECHFLLLGSLDAISVPPGWGLVTAPGSEQVASESLPPIPRPMLLTYFTFVFAYEA